jgi:hypothetical protein
LAHFLTCRHPFTIDQPSSLDFHIASYLSAQGSLIALMMEAVRTSETSFGIYFTTRQKILNFIFAAVET